MWSGPSPEEARRARTAPHPTTGPARGSALLELVGADAVFMAVLVAGVDAVREGLDQRHQGRVGAGEGGAVGGVVEGQLGVLPHLRHRGVGDRQGASVAVQGQLHRPQQQRVGAAGGEGDDQRFVVDPAEALERLAAGAGDDLGADVEQAEGVAQVAGEESHLVDADDDHALRLGQRGDGAVDLLAGQLARGFLEVGVVGAERALELGVVEGEERAGAGAAAGGGASRPVLLDRGLLQLGVALEAERLREAHDGRGRGAGAAGQLLGGEEGGLVEVVDDVAGDVFLGAREVLEALLDVVGEARQLRGGFSCGLGHGAEFRQAPRFPFTASGRSGWMGAAMTLEQALRLTNRNMVAFDLVLGSAAIAAPAATLKVLGHDQPSPDAEHLFRRCGPIWLTFAAAHAIAAHRGEQRDWWALAWLRGTEIATDALWAESAAVSRPGAKLGLRLAGVANLAMAAGFAWLSRR